MGRLGAIIGTNGREWGLVMS